MRRFRSRLVLSVVALGVIASASNPMALAQEADRSADAAVAAFPRLDTSAAVALDGVAIAGPVVLTLRPPGDVPPSLQEQIRHLKARLDNAYPDASDARKLAFIADYLGIDFRRLWNAYHPDTSTRPTIDVRPADARPVDARPVDRARPAERPRTVDPVKVRPAQIVRVGPVARPIARPPVTVRPTRPNR